MSEAHPNGQRDSNELKELIRELESQIESVNAGLGKIRGTVARIAYASLGTATPPPSSLWSNGIGSAFANGQSQAAAAIETPPPAAQQPGPSPAVEQWKAPPEPEADPGFWTSVAEGASWPRAAEAVPAPAQDTPAPDAAADESDWSAFFPDDKPSEVQASIPTEPQTVDAGSLTWSVPGPEPPMSGADLAEPPLAEHDPANETILTEESGAPSHSEAWMLEAAVEPLLANAETLSAAEAPASEAPEVPEVGGQLPNTLSSGWPDESVWSQSFEWPAMKTDTRAAGVQDAYPAQDAALEASPVDVSDIVAQVKAEIEAARANGMELPVEVEVEAGTVAGAEPATAAVDDDEARREEVSRAVAEMRAQIQAGDFDGVMRSNGFEDAAGTLGLDAPSGAPDRSEEDVRSEVRRAVEAARVELSGIRGGTPGGDKPAFRLAAPGSIPDWSHMKMEQSGPPVVVMKDADGRVELASVYETLNELGCGDGAALLNYTPHSVTVGLPITSQVPSKEQVAEAVEKVFGLTSRVESDGVRITVSIGDDPKRRSVA